VTDGGGANRWPDVSLTAFDMWTLPPGTNAVSVTVTGGTSRDVGGHVLRPAVPDAVTGQFTVIARDADLNRIGDASAYTSLEVHPRHNDVGAWSLAYPVDSPAAQLFSAGGGVLIYRKGSTSR
jgi:hypothetical protein